ncbi:MAG: DUF4465 domain-containing protein [Pirellula sp.]
MFPGQNALRAMRLYTAQLALFVLPGVLASGSRLQADIIGFEGNTLYSQGSNNRYYNGDLGSNTTNSQGWTNGGVHFSNSYTYDSQYNFGYWSGFAYSRVNAGNVAGYENQYASKPGTGSGGSEHYAVVYNSFSGDAVVTFGAQVQLNSIDVSNTAYTYFSMKDGDQYAKKFGGASGNDPDFFKLEIQGFRNSNATSTVELFLADYRFENNAQDYLVDQWTRVNLSSLGTVDTLKFALTSSDNGQYGMNTPAYFAMDRMEFSAVPEPSSILLLATACAALRLYRRKTTWSLRNFNG